LITKIILFAEGDGRYVLSTIFKIMYIKRFTPSLYISLMGYFCKIIAGKQDTTPKNAVEDLLLLICIQEVMGSNLGPECQSKLIRFTILTPHFHTNSEMSTQIRGQSLFQSHHQSLVTHLRHSIRVYTEPKLSAAS